MTICSPTDSWYLFAIKFGPLWNMQYQHFNELLCVCEHKKLKHGELKRAFSPHFAFLFSKGC